jgi:hypothetical protein
MSTALGLAMQISANTAQLAQAVQDVNAKLDAMGASGKKAANDLSVLKTIEISRVLLDGLQLAARAFTTVAGKAREWFDVSREQIDQLGKLSEQTQISVEALQTYGAVADEAGIGSEEFAKALRRLTVEVGKAEVDAESSVFKDLGLDIEKLKAQKPEDTFLQVADALANISNDAERAAAANEVFGKGGITLLPLINGGADALKRAADEAGRIGGVLTQDQVKNVEAMNDAFSQVGKALGGIINQVTASLSPALTTAAQQFVEFVKTAGGANIGKSIADSLLRFVEIFVTAFKSVAVFLDQFLGALVSLVSKIPGVDLRTNTEKELADLQSKQASAYFMRGLTDAQKKQLNDRILELQRQVQAEQQARGAASGISIEGIADSILEGVRVARLKLQTDEAATAGTVDPGLQARIDQAVQNNEPLNYDELLNEVRGLRRESGIGTVSIIGGA